MTLTTMTLTDEEALKEASLYLKARFELPQCGLVLGSGLGALSVRLKNRIVVPYQDIPHAPRSLVEGHAGELVFGELGGVAVAMLSGRAHLYEHGDVARAVFLVRLLAAFGIKRMLLTNAAGSVNQALRPGDVMVIDDHINLTAHNPLVGHNPYLLAHRFVDMSQAYHPTLANILYQQASRLNMRAYRGVYAGLLGPSYETPAEIRMLRALGADAVGMSTVLETIALRHQNVHVAALSCITNLGAGMSKTPLSHQEVTQIAQQVRTQFMQLIEDSLPLMVTCELH